MIRLRESFNTCFATFNTLVADTESLVQNAVNGNLSARADASKHSGDFKKIVEGINSTLDAIVTPINEASEVLERVAAKDMTVRMQGDYKGDYARIKQSLNAAVDNLDQGLGQVSLGAEQVASASAQISSGSQSLAQGASEQASSLEEISSSLQEMASMTKQNASNAKEARGLSEGARSAADKGVESMRRLSEAIDKIKMSSDETAKIVKTIDEIAFQTNLLALNAAVEAARAGDAGRGFAVVAEEVRNLAMRSAEAAKNTANMIEESVKNAEDGVAINQEVLRNLDEINDQAQKVSEVIAEIAAASDQQTQGVDQINTAVTQMDQITQQNAANSEESASAAEEMSSQAQEMQAMVSSFKITNTGSGATPVVHQKRREKVLASSGARARKSAPQPEDVIPFDDDSALREF
jgi:methyl-accepting chemotaxis protein